VAERLPEAAGAWEALPIIERAANAVLIRVAEARAEVGNSARFMAALSACPLEMETLTCLRKLVAVLDRAEVIVLHPSFQRGYRVRISGIGDNFQLHTLLADALIGDPDQGWLPGQRPDRRVAAAAKDGPFPLPGSPRGDVPIAVGAFNLWNWQGLQPDGTLPTGRNGTEHWTWNEGVPADITLFEGQRVLLLGPQCRLLSEAWCCVILPQYAANFSTFTISSRDFARVRR
jgi:hypothetical protein